MIIRSSATGIIFPPEQGGNPDVAILNNVAWQASATTVNVHIPFVPGYTQFWVEWSQQPDFSSGIHVAGLVLEGTGFDTVGQWYINTLTGFAPESTWYFRAAASSNGEYPDQTPEQWNEP